MTILVTHEFAPFRGGIATYVRETAHAAARLGRPVKVIAPDYGRAPCDEDATEIFPIERVPCSGRLSPAGIWSLARALAQRRDVLRGSRIVLLSPGAMMAMMIARELKWISTDAPVITFFHGSEVLRFSRHPIWRRLGARFFRHTQPACATQFVEHLIRESGLFAADIRVLRAPCACPADIVATAPATDDVSNLHADSCDDIEFLTLARLHPRKGQLQTARALALLPPGSKLRVRYIMAGEGSPAYRHQVAQACRGSGIRYEFRSMASPQERPRIYAHCDVFVMTSVALPGSVEGFGISYLEASIHGKPVLGFRSGGVEEAVRQNVTGLLVEEGDLEGLAANMQRMILEPELRHRLGEAGREFARGFSWEHAARTLCAE